MKVNPKKSKILPIAKKENNNNIQIYMEGTQMEVVTEYKYLGTIFTQNGKINQEVQHRIQLASMVHHQIRRTLIKKPEIEEKTKLQIYNTVFVPILTYGAESWPITSKIQSKLTAAEMRFLRDIKNKTKLDKIRNTTIREQLKQQDLLGMIEKKQLQWYGHVTRMENNRIPKQVHEARPIGNKSRGRPTQTYIQNIEQYSLKRNLTIAEITKTAKNRKEFKKLISKNNRT